jgi:AAA domain
MNRSDFNELDYRGENIMDLAPWRNDPLYFGMSDQAARASWQAAQLRRPKLDNLRPASQDIKREPVTSADLQDFLARTFPPRELMLAPWLQRQGLAMIHGYRGFGKTMMAHGSAWAIATGGGFWKWKAPEPRRVLILDGEMPASDLQVRLRNIQDNSELIPAFKKIDRW